MKPSTKGVVDVVFCLDASGSMAPCIDGVRRNIGSFLDGLASDANRKIDCRIDYLAHCCSEDFSAFRAETLRTRDFDCLSALYGQSPKPEKFFSSEAGEIRKGLEKVEVFGDEAVLVAIDVCLDFPWRPRGQCHRVVAVLTDEPFESNAFADKHKPMIGPLIDKIHALGVMLFLVAPKSPGYDELSEADKCQFQQTGQMHDGLSSLDFARVLAHIGKSVSVATPFQGEAERPVKRALFGQSDWQRGHKEIKGGK
jgi:hypothetical protein